jgi:hypothetical protein
MFVLIVITRVNFIGICRNSVHKEMEICFKNWDVWIIYIFIEICLHFRDKILKGRLYFFTF